MPTSWKVENVVKGQKGHKNKIPEKKFFIPTHSAGNREKNGKCEF